MMHLARAGYSWPGALALVGLALALLLSGATALATAAVRGTGRGSLAFVQGDSIRLLDVDRLFVYTVTGSPFLPVRSPAWSPDGREIAFVRQNARRTGWSVYRMAANGHRIQRVTPQGDDVHVNPAWSPDGTRIAFDSTRGGSLDVYIIELACAPDCAPRRVTTHPFADVSPAWSPDGRSIAFESSRDEHREIYRLDLESGSEHRLTVNRVPDRGPAWSPDGSQIVFARDRNLYVIDAGCDARPEGCAASEHPLLLVEQDAAAPAWSPDGRWIAFESWTDRRWALFLLDVETGVVERLTHGDTDAREAAWWPR